MKVWYDTLQVKPARDIPIIRRLLLDIPLLEDRGDQPDSVFTQIQDVTIREKERAEIEYEIKFFNRKRIKFRMQWYKGAYMWDDDVIDEEKFVALAVAEHK